MKNIYTTVTALLVMLLLLPFAAVPAAGQANTGAGLSSVTIHKLLVDGTKELALEQKGTRITDPDKQYVYKDDPHTTLSDLKGLNGAAFTIMRVQDDATTIQDAHAWAPEGTPGMYSSTKVTERIYGEDGIVIFNQIPQGVYLVTEDGESGWLMAFLLRVPIPDPEDGSDNHDIHIYPKNAEPRSTALTKTVRDRLGDAMTWEYAWQIPESIKNGKRILLTDDLDSRLDFASASVAYSGKNGVRKQLDDKLYRVTYDEKANTVFVTIESADAFQLLARVLQEEGEAAPELYVEVNTVIKQSAAGTIYNSGTLSFEEKGGGPNPHRPREDPYVIVEKPTGGLLIYKYDAETGVPLAGAVFDVYASRADAKNRRNAVTTAVTTGEDGYALFKGLPYEGSGRKYWVVETKAPLIAGSDQRYNLLQDPVEVTVGPNSHTEAACLKVANRANATVPSSPPTTEEQDPSSPEPTQSDPGPSPSSSTDDGGPPASGPGRSGRFPKTGEDGMRVEILMICLGFAGLLVVIWLWRVRLK